MANNYLQFSFSFSVSKDELDFIDSLLTVPEDNEQLKEWAGMLGIDLEVTEEFDLECWPDFETEPIENGCWFVAREYGNIENVAKVLQAFLTKFPRDKGIGFTWAETCDKMRLDQFAGGACWVSGDGKTVEWQGARQFFDECEGSQKV